MTEYKEIGGYFELERFVGEEYHHDAIALNCARNCLVYLIEARTIQSIWIPSFLCSSVATAVRKAGAAVHEYEIRPDFTPDYSHIDLDQADYLYLVDYYGQVSDEAIKDAHRFCNGRLVVDEVQNFFRHPLPGIDTLYSCRKYFGVPDGAYLYTDISLKREVPIDQSRSRMAHLLGRAERPASESYANYAQNDKNFAEEPVKLMSPITHNILRGIDYERAAQVRSTNFGVLHGLLGGKNQLNPTTPQGAYMYPLLIDNATPMRKAMQQRKLYIPTLWPGSTEHEGLTGYYSRNILPLPVDQRYTADDMRYMVKALLEIINTL